MTVTERPNSPRPCTCGAWRVVGLGHEPGCAQIVRPALMRERDVTDWRGRNVRIFPGWDVLRRAPFVEGHVVSLRPAMWVVRDAEGVEQEWPVTLPIEEA